MKNIKIFCEGVTDQIFIADCLKLFFNMNVSRTPDKKDKLKCKVSFHNATLQGEVIEVGGCSYLTNDTYIQMLKDNTEEDGINIVVFDADFSIDADGDKQGNGNKGLKSCIQKLKAIQSKYDMQFHFYLWPNDKMDGEIENLLKQFIPKEKLPIFDCIEQNQLCLKRTNIPNLMIADLKQKIGYYLYTANQGSEPRKRNYTDALFWNLDWATIPDLFAFKTFLTQKAGF